MGRVLGAPDVITAAEGQAISEFLESCWSLQFDRAPGDLQDDLQRTKEFFDPVARGGRLRDRLNHVSGGLAERPEALDDVAVLSFGNGRHLITPEGRGLLHILRATSPDRDGLLRLRSADSQATERVVADAIRGWSRHRLLDVIAKQEGHGPPMLPVALAMVLLLLVNGSTSRATAVRRLNDKRQQDALDEIVADILAAFADVIDPDGRRDKHQFSLWQGYPLTEARRRLPRSLVVEDREFLYVRGDRIDEVISFVGREIARRQVPVPTRLAAFDALVSAYRGRLNSLANFNSGFERLATTDAIRRALVEAHARD